MQNYWRYLFAVLVAAMLAACGGSDGAGDPGDVPPGEDIPREEGQTEFWSAAGAAGDEATNDSMAGGDDMDDAAPEFDGSDEGRGDDATVEEGDIYRLMGDGIMLNLNAYRGLQVIDISDTDNPHIIGRAAMSGYPVEMYVVDKTAFILMNNWSGYYGSRYQTLLRQIRGGVVVVVDMSNLEAPRVMEQRPIAGNILKSRVVRDSNAANLFIASQRYGHWEDELEDGSTYYAKTFVTSLDISDRKAEVITEIELGGWVTDIQATTRYLMVARGSYQWWDEGLGSTISLIDITDPRGSMVEGSQVRVRGEVYSQFNMDIHGDVMRIVSGARWGGAASNWLQTYDISDFQNLELIDEVSFGDGMNLFATLFLGNKAFFVTFFRVDPFHAFEITDEGYAQEISEYEVSGWNDFFRPVLNESRLIGIGINDEEGQRVAVSLYDITDLANPEPMIARREVSSRWSWSEANWDHRAFSVLEDAVVAYADDGTLETGLVLLPYSGYDDTPGYHRYRSNVQIFTFSEDTLTARGVLSHPTPVRRAFLAEADTAANLSETDLGFHDLSDPDEPQELGSVQLAPNYVQIIETPTHILRVQGPSQSWGYYDRSRDMDGAGEVHVLAADEDDLDSATAIASFNIHGNASVHFSDSTLYAVSYLSSDGYTREGLKIERWDLSDPSAPSLIDSRNMRSNRFRDYDYYGYGYGWCDAFGCWSGFNYQRPDTALVGQSIVLQFTQYHSEVIGEAESCNYYLISNGCEDLSMDEDDCDAYYRGSRRCVRDVHETELTCRSDFQRCVQDDEGYYDECEEFTPTEDQLYGSCHTYERYRYWNQAHFEIVDLSGHEPALLPRLSMDRDLQTVGTLIDGDNVWYSYSVPATRPGDSRPYERFYVQQLDFSAGGRPEISPAVNVPGSLIAVDGDQMVFQDLVYHEDRVHTAMARARYEGDHAVLEAFRRLDDLMITALVFEENGNALLTVRGTHNRYGYGYPGYYDDDIAVDVSPLIAGPDSNPDGTFLLILDALEGNSFEELSITEVDSWATLRGTKSGSAVFQVSGGLLLFNISDLSSPWPQAYLPMLGWPRGLMISGDRLHVAAERYGIYSFDLTKTNLLAP